MPVKVSVVVPVYNTGVHLDQLVDSLLRQSLPADEFEAIFVDDGSTDESPAKLDAWERSLANVRVIHIPNSGWPGRPRNLGIDAAVGEYILFVDHDDLLGDEALERMYNYARENDADVVVGKEVRSPGRWSWWPMFERNIPDAKLGDDQILSLLTPHKMFRRRFLLDHAIRFFEGPRRLEDHPFVTKAYLLAERISVLADYPCYIWRRHPDRGNAGSRPRDWPEWYGFMEDALDAVEEHTEPGEFRDRLLMHWYSGKALGLGIRVMSEAQGSDAEYYFKSLCDLVDRRFPPSLDHELPGFLQARAALVRAHDLAGFQALAVWETGVHAVQRDATVLTEDGRVRVQGVVEVLDGDGRPVEFAVSDSRVTWQPPSEVGIHLREPVDVTKEFSSVRVDLVVQERRTSEGVPIRGPRGVELDAGERVPLVIPFSIVVDPDNAGSGHRVLEDGVHDVHLLVRAAGRSLRARAVAPPGSAPRRPIDRVDLDGTVAAFATTGGHLALEIGRRRLPRVAAAANPRSVRLVGGAGRPVALLARLPYVSASDAELRRRCRVELTRSDDGAHRTLAARLEGKPGARSARLRARLPLGRGAKRPLPEGTWGLRLILGGRRQSLPHVLEVGRKKVILRDGAGNELSRIVTKAPPAG